MRDITINVSADELRLLSHIMWHFTFFIDEYKDRIDRGEPVLRRYKRVPEETKHCIYQLADRLEKQNRKKQNELYQVRKANKPNVVE